MGDNSIGAGVQFSSRQSQFNAFMSPKDYYKLTLSQDRKQNSSLEKKDKIKKELVMMKRQVKTINQLMGEDINKKNGLELNKINWYYKKSFNKQKIEKQIEFSGAMNKLINNIKSSSKNLNEIKKKNDSFRIEDPKSQIIINKFNSIFQVYMIFTISEINQKFIDKKKKGFQNLSSRDFKKSLNRSFDKATLNNLPLTDQDESEDEQAFQYQDSRKSSGQANRKNLHQHAVTFDVIKNVDFQKQKKIESTDRQVDYARFNNIINQTQVLCQELIPDIKKLAKTKKMQDKQQLQFWSFIFLIKVNL